MVPVWMSRRPRDVPTQTQQRTTAEIFQFRRGTYFSQIVELFRVSRIVPKCAKSALDRRRRDGVPTQNGLKARRGSPARRVTKLLCAADVALSGSRRCDLGGGATTFTRGVPTRMADLCDYASRPLAFVFHYVRLRPFSHAVILAAVLSAVACSVGTQYGVKFLVDVLSNHAAASVARACL